MRVGDLVKLVNCTEVHKVNPHVSPDSIGLVMEWNPPAKTNPVSSRAPRGGDGWVLWNGRRDWDREYEEDLEVINES